MDDDRDWMEWQAVSFGEDRDRLQEWEAWRSESSALLFFGLIYEEKARNIESTQPIERVGK